MDKLGRQLQYTFQLYLQRFYRMRTAVLLLLIYFAFDWNYSQLDRVVEALNYPASPWYILSVLTNDFMCACMGLGAVYLFSGAPYLQRNGMYQMIRCGKGRWAAAQMGSIVLSSVTLTISLFFLGLIRMLPRVDWTLSWGKLMTTLSATDAARQFGMTYGIAYSFLESMEAWQAGILALVLDSLVFTLIGWFLFSLGLYWGRTAAVTVTGFLAALPFATESCLINLRRSFHMVSPVSWLQTGLFHTKQMVYSVFPEEKTVFLLMAVYLTVTVVLTALAVRRGEFLWNGEEE